MLWLTLKIVGVVLAYVLIGGGLAAARQYAEPWLFAREVRLNRTAHSYSQTTQYYGEVVLGLNYLWPVILPLYCVEAFYDFSGTWAKERGLADFQAAKARAAERAAQADAAEKALRDYEDGLAREFAQLEQASAKRLTSGPLETDLVKQLQSIYRHTRTRT